MWQDKGWTSGVGMSLIVGGLTIATLGNTYKIAVLPENAALIAEQGKLAANFVAPYKAPADLLGWMSVLGGTGTLLAPYLLPLVNAAKSKSSASKKGNQNGEYSTQEYYAQKMYEELLLMKKEMMALKSQSAATKKERVDSPQPVPMPVESTHESFLPDGNKKPTATLRRVERAKNEIDDSWLRKIAQQIIDRKSHHFAVFGGSTSGKSTLFSRVLELVLEGLEGVVTVCLSDPKYPMTDWPIRADFKGYQEVYEGLKELVKELETRKKKSVLAKEAGLPTPQFNRYFYIQDEWSNCWGKGQGYGSIIPKDRAVECRNMLLQVIREGAAYNMGVCMIGQNPLNPSTGLDRSDFSSSTVIVVGKEAIKYINESTFPAMEEDKKVMLRQIDDWRRDDPEQRICVCIPMNDPPFVARIPFISIEEERFQVEEDPWADKVVNLSNYR